MGDRASASTTAKSTSASNARGQASASTVAAVKEASVRNAGGWASVSTTAKDTAASNSAGRDLLSSTS